MDFAKEYVNVLLSSRAPTLCFGEGVHFFFWMHFVIPVKASLYVGYLSTLHFGALLQLHHFVL